LASPNAIQVAVHGPRVPPVDLPGVRPSMGSVGDCFDNALCDRFFATLECELLGRQRFRTQAEARLAVFDFIEGWYNLNSRSSSTRGVEFEPSAHTIRNWGGAGRQRVAARSRILLTRIIHEAPQRPRNNQPEDKYTA